MAPERQSEQKIKLNKHQLSEDRNDPREQKRMKVSESEEKGGGGEGVQE